MEELGFAVGAGVQRQSSRAIGHPQAAHLPYCIIGLASAQGGEGVSVWACSYRLAGAADSKQR